MPRSFRGGIGGANGSTPTRANGCIFHFAANARRQNTADSGNLASVRLRSPRGPGRIEGRIGGVA